MVVCDRSGRVRIRVGLRKWTSHHSLPRRALERWASRGNRKATQDSHEANGLRPPGEDARGDHEAAGLGWPIALPSGSHEAKGLQPPRGERTGQTEAKGLRPARGLTTCRGAEANTGQADRRLRRDSNTLVDPLESTPHRGRTRNTD